MSINSVKTECWGIVDNIVAEGAVDENECGLKNFLLAGLDGNEKMNLAVLDRYL